MPTQVMNLASLKKIKINIFLLKMLFKLIFEKNLNKVLLYNKDVSIATFHLEKFLNKI